MQARQQVSVLTHDVGALSESKRACWAALAQCQRFIQCSLSDIMSAGAAKLESQQRRLDNLAASLREQAHAAVAERRGHVEAIAELDTTVHALEDRVSVMQKRHRELEGALATEAGLRADMVQSAVGPLQARLDAALDHVRTVELDLDVARALALSLRQVRPHAVATIDLPIDPCTIIRTSRGTLQQRRQ